MSRYTEFHNNYDRCDSAQDLPFFEHHQSFEDWEGSQTISASSVVHSPGPWSSVNTRNGSEPSHPYAPVEWPPDPDNFGNAISLGYNPTILEPDLSPYVPEPSLYSAETESLGGYSATSSTVPTSWATTPNGFYVPTRSPNRTSDTNASQCQQCDRKFTGAYQRGNLARHVRQKHTGANCGLLTCIAEGCFKTFQRPDARLKHARRQHPELALQPASRREHAVSSSQADSDQNLNYVGHWLQAEQGFINSHALSAQHLVDPSAAVEGLRAAKSVFSTLQLKLDPGTYSHVRNSFFARWESVIQRLKDDRSSAYPAYAKAIEELRTVAHADLTDQPYDVTPGGSHGHNGAGRAVPRDLGSSGGITSPTGGRISKRSERQASFSSSSGQNAIAMGKRPLKGNKSVDCPVYKYCIMHNLRPPCHGCQENVMSQVRNHINPDRTATHRGFPAFIAHCRRCQQDFIDRHLYSLHEDSGNCIYQPQRRGDIVTSWVQLYLTLYPGETQVPSPWCDEQRWLHSSVVAPYRSPHADQTVPDPFLGHRAGRSSSHSAALHNAPDPIEQPVHDAVIRHMLLDIANPAVIQPSPSSQPVLNDNRVSPVELHASSLSSPGNNIEHWQNVLDSLRLHQRTIRQASAFLLPYQLSILAAESEQMFNLHRSMYDQQTQPQMQHVLSQAQHAPSNYNPAPETASPAYATPSVGTQAEYAPSNYYSTQGIAGSTYSTLRTSITSRLPDQRSYGATSINTQPSTQGYDTGSSLQQNSFQTEPSSTHETGDPMLLSPGYPMHRRRTSLPPEVDQDGPRLRSRHYSRRSLQDELGSEDDEDRMDRSRRRR